MPTVPELVAVWRARIDGVSYRAGQALLAIGDREGLAAVADDIAEVEDIAHHVALTAAFALGPDEAFDRLAPLLVPDGEHANAVLYQLEAREGVLEGDSRWLPLVIAAFERGTADHRDVARAVLLRRVPVEVLRAHWPEDPPPRGAPDPAVLGKARTAMRRLAAELPREVWTPPPADQAARLTALEEVLGPLPAMVRAVFETFDGIEVPAARPGDRFIVYDLDVVMAELSVWRRAIADGAPRCLWLAFHFPIAPDGYTRGGFSGGPAIGFAMPTDEQDPPLKHERRNPRLSSFVRRAKRRAAQQ